jgi:hypothetical protein
VLFDTLAGLGVGGGVCAAAAAAARAAAALPRTCNSSSTFIQCMVAL